MSAPAQSTPSATPPSSQSTADSRPPVPLSVILRMVLLEVVIGGALLAPTIIGLSLKVLQLSSAQGKESALAVVMSVGAFTSLILTPIFGHLSDRTRSRWGMRSPWILGGIAGGLLGMIVVAMAPGIGSLALGWALAQAGYAAALAAVYGMLADLVPESQRANASGLFGAGAFAGMIPSLIVAAAFSANLPVAFLLMPVVALVVAALVLWSLHERSSREAQVPALSLGSIFGSLIFNPWRYRQFSWVWLQRFAIQFGYITVGTFGVYYLIERLGMSTSVSAQTTSLTSIVTALLTLVASAAFGWWAGRTKRYLPFMIISILVLALACVLKALTASLLVFWVSTLLLAFALGCFYAVDLAVVMRTFPQAEAGRYLGVFNIAKTLPQSLAPALAPLFLGIGGVDPISGKPSNYLALYLAAAVLVLLSAIPLFKLTAARRNAS